MLLALAACAQSPQRPASPKVLNSSLGTFPVGSTAETTPSVAPQVVSPVADTAEGAASAAAIVPADPAPALAPTATEVTPGTDSPPPPGPTQVAGLDPAQYADLFDRMRAGFRLEDGEEHHVVDQELHWYVSNPDYLQRAFGRADLYLYHIVTELERRGMPLELALLPVVESAFEPYAYSRARASGLWQFIPGTGSKYGLKQDWWYDGRRDIVESTRAVDMNRAAGRPVDFWDLWLPRETRAYVPKLLAMKRLVLDPEGFGLAFSPIPNQPYFTRVSTQGQVNLRIAAEIAGISPDELYELNPAFHRWATDPGGPHFMLLPVNAADVFADNITQLSADQRLGVAHYTVHRGDSLATVALKFHTSVNVLRELNDMPAGSIAVGDDLRVPGAMTDLPAKVVLAAARVDGHGRGRSSRAHVQVVRRGDSLWTIARRTGVNVNTLAVMNGLQPDDPLRAGQRIKLSTDTGGRVHRRHIEYTVRDGDTPSLIARLFQCSVPQLLAWNGLSARSHLHAGQKLRIHLTSHHS